MIGQQNTLRKPFSLGFAALAVVLSGCSGNGSIQEGTTPIKVDLLLTGGLIKSGPDWVEAMAVSDGEIVELGSTSELESYASNASQIVDLNGRVVLPGFHDMHVHPLFSGLGFKCDIADGLDLQAFREALKGCVAAVEPGDWVVGRRWDEYALGVTPHRDLIDDISPDNPVFLNDTSGHSAWANSKALEIAGVDADTEAPRGGEIVRDENGETGVLYETAMGFVSQVIPPQYSDAEIRTSLRSALDEMTKYGLTSFVEASTGFAAGLEIEVATYAEFADSGDLKQRSRLCLEWFPGTQRTVDDYIALRDSHRRDRLSADCIKIFLDGVPTSSHTAAMLQPYVDYSGGVGVYGTVFIDPAELNRVVAEFDAAGFSVKFHAAGDAAVRAGLDAIEAAREANGMGGPAHSVGHCTFVSPQDMPRGPGINATFEMSPYLWAPSPISSDIANAVGPDLVRDVWPVKSTIESGALTIPGSDWAVVPSVNPWIAVETLVTREGPGGTDSSFGKRQAITVEQAIDLFTINSAKHLGQDDILGSLELGKRADFIVIDRNPYQIPANTLHQTVVEMTVIDGEVVFER